MLSPDKFFFDFLKTPNYLFCFFLQFNKFLLNKLASKFVAYTLIKLIILNEPEILFNHSKLKLKFDIFKWSRDPIQPAKLSTPIEYKLRF